MLSDADRADLSDLAPLLRRVAGLAPRTVVRLRAVEGSATAWVWLPFAVLASRRVVASARPQPLDVTVRADEALAWLEGTGAPAPAARDAEWRWPLPPPGGWRHVDSVPDDVVRGVVRSGALALKDAAAREGVPGAQPRAEVADALLDAVVLTVDGNDLHAEVTLRPLSALTRLGFLPRGGDTRIDVAGGWIRVSGEYGSTYRNARPALRLA